MTRAWKLAPRKVMSVRFTSSEPRTREAMKTLTLDKRNERVLLWAVFAAYVLLLLMALAKHELWGDEIAA